MASVEYHGKYKKLFPGTLSSNSLLSVYILHMLSKTTRMYGKEIADGITNRLKGTWTPSHGLVYPMLRNMEDEGLVSAVWEGEGSKKTKRFYQLTTKGKEALLAETEHIRPAFEQSKEMLSIVMNDLYVPTT